MIQIQHFATFLGIFNGLKKTWITECIQIMVHCSLSNTYATFCHLLSFFVFLLMSIRENIPPTIKTHVITKYKMYLLNFLSEENTGMRSMTMTTEHRICLLLIIF